MTEPRQHLSAANEHEAITLVQILDCAVYMEILANDGVTYVFPKEELEKARASILSSCGAEYERRWRQALKERDCALAEVDDHNLALLKIAGAISQLQLAEESTSDEVTRRHLREIYAALQQVGQS